MTLYIYYIVEIYVPRYVYVGFSFFGYHFRTFRVPPKMNTFSKEFENLSWTSVFSQKNESCTFFFAQNEGRTFLFKKR